MDNHLKLLFSGGGRGRHFGGGGFGGPGQYYGGQQGYYNRPGGFGGPGFQQGFSGPGFGGPGFGGQGFGGQSASSAAASAQSANGGILAIDQLSFNYSISCEF